MQYIGGMTPYQKRFQEKAALFRKLGYEKPTDLILHLPLRYEDHTRLHPIETAAIGTMIVCDVWIIAQQKTPKQRGQYLLICDTQDPAGTPLRLRFLHAYAADCTRLQTGQSFRVTGLLREKNGIREIIHPQYRPVTIGDTLPQYLTPIYPTTAGLTQARIHQIVMAVLTASPRLTTLPHHFYTQRNWPKLSEALHFLHQPPATAAHLIEQLNTRTHPAWLCLQWEELLAHRLCLRAVRQNTAQHLAPILINLTQQKEFLSALPFTLTMSQQQCWQEIAADLTRGQPMRRLLQGDVGSGKTVVAGLTALAVLSHGKQVAYMAPTELLSKQVYEQFDTWFTPLGYRVILLISDLSEKEKKKRRTAIATGEYDCVIGTHSLIQSETRFCSLQLVIIDEQHRFGVKQRLSLQQKSTEPTHQLMMSATPIPRSLSMTYYADLAISSIREKPSNRQPTQTSIISVEKKDLLVERLSAICHAEHQAYWVCPLIAESEDSDLIAAEKRYQELQTALPNHRVLFLHGRLKNTDKDQHMRTFLAGEADLLVCTTVIEVGIHVPKANIMIIEQAERFGLTQLHQLRGRVGRGNTSGQCILLYHPPLSAKAKERLQIIQNTDDGFVIAEEDLKLRGAGTVLGEKQSGAETFRFATNNLQETQLADIEETSHIIEEHYPEAVDTLKNFWFPDQLAFSQT